MGFFSFFKRSERCGPVSPNNPYYLLYETLRVSISAMESYDFVYLDGPVGNDSPFDYETYVIGRLRAGFPTILQIKQRDELAREDMGTIATMIHIYRRKRELDSKLNDKNLTRLAIVAQSNLSKIAEIARINIEGRFCIVSSIGEAEQKLGVGKRNLDDIVGNEMKAG